MADVRTPEPYEIIHFGKYKGRTWESVPVGYLNWGKRNSTGWLGKRCSKELRRRADRAYVRMTWCPPEPPEYMTDDDRMSGFSSFVDLSGGGVFDVERWSCHELVEYELTDEDVLLASMSRLNMTNCRG